MKGSVADRFAVNLHLKAIVRLDNESVQRSRLDNACHGRILEMLLFILASLGVLMAENEVDLHL